MVGDGAEDEDEDVFDVGGDGSVCWSCSPGNVIRILFSFFLE